MIRKTNLMLDSDMVAHKIFEIETGVIGSSFFLSFEKVNSRDITEKADRNNKTVLFVKLIQDIQEFQLHT